MTCGHCGRAIDSCRQGGLALPDVPPRCDACDRKAQIAHMLAGIPEEDGDPGWDRLTEWEQEFLPSVREQFERRGDVTEKQYNAIERILEKIG